MSGEDSEMDAALDGVEQYRGMFRRQEIRAEKAESALALEKQARVKAEYELKVLKDSLGSDQHLSEAMYDLHKSRDQALARVKTLETTVMDKVLESLKTAQDGGKLSMSVDDATLAQLVNEERDAKEKAEAQSAAHQAEAEGLRDNLLSIRSALNCCYEGLPARLYLEAITEARLRIGTALAKPPAAFSRELEAAALRKAADWFQAWKGMPASYERAAEALYRMADDALRAGKEGA